MGHRAVVKDGLNMYLGEKRPENTLDDSKWHGNGMPGIFQFMSYIGRQPIRPGVKMQTDMACSTAPGENSRAFNVTQMTGSIDKFKSEEARGVENLGVEAHQAAVATLRSLQSHA